MTDASRITHPSAARHFKLTREEVLRQVGESIRRDLDLMEERTFLGLPSHRTFVCQGCGKVHAVLHGTCIKCRCGVWSAAEVLP